MHERPRLILTDLYLPEMDGFVATAHIRKYAELRNVPIVAFLPMVNQALVSIFRWIFLRLGTAHLLLIQSGLRSLGKYWNFFC